MQKKSNFYNYTVIFTWLWLTDYFHSLYFSLYIPSLWFLSYLNQHSKYVAEATSQRKALTNTSCWNHYKFSRKKKNRYLKVSLYVFQEKQKRKRKGKKGNTVTILQMEWKGRKQFSDSPMVTQEISSRGRNRLQVLPIKLPMP